MKPPDLILDGESLSELFHKWGKSGAFNLSSPRELILEKLIRCSLRAFKKHLNTPETRIIRRAAKRLGIEVENVRKL